MTDKEKDEIVGSTFRELRSLREKLKAVNAQLYERHERLRDMAELCRRYSISSEPSLWRLWPATVDDLPQLIETRNSLIEKIVGLSHHARELGLE